MTHSSTNPDKKPTWENVRPGMQLLINGYAWEVVGRKGNEFTIGCPALNKVQTGRPNVTKEVEILYPGDPKYMADRQGSQIDRLWEALPDQGAVAVALVSVRLGGQIIAQRLETPEHWVVPYAATDTDQRHIEHLMLFHDVFLPDVREEYPTIYELHDGMHAEGDLAGTLVVKHRHGEIE